MNSAEDSVRSLPRRRSLSGAFGWAAASPRLCIYFGCTLVAVMANYFLGKDVMWDTLDYHLYAGFSALHDRFNFDYFAAGSQSYFNPYIYAPFYLLALSGLPAIAAASILAIVQSAILWLTYELTLEIAPPYSSRMRMTMGLCAVALAFANPILINQFGSSFADVTTAEVVVLAWLVLVRSIRVPRSGVVAFAGALLGIASALKLTNCVHALSAGVLVLFLPGNWWTKLRHSFWFGAAVAASFVIVCARWSVQLEHHFGNPLFPLLNNVFRSPQFPAASLVDYRFVPDSIGEALWRPFAIVIPQNMVDDELAAPDLRYAVLLVAGCLLVGGWMWRRLRSNPSDDSPASAVLATRALIALACGFLVDWILWLAVSANGRYFIAMACVAAVLGVVIIFRLFASRPKAVAYVMSAILGVQAVQLYLGADYRYPASWQNRPWFDVSVAKTLAAQPNLYLSFGMQSDSFLVPFLARGSGFVNLAGDYELGSDGPNGEHVESLIRRYSPYVRIITRDPRAEAAHDPGAPSPSEINAALEPFGLRLDQGDCAKIVVRDGSPEILMTVASAAATVPSTPAEKPHPLNTDYYVSCGTVRDTGDDSWYRKTSREVDLVFDRVEDACPELFQPRRPVTQYLGRGRYGGIWERQYGSTNLALWISRGWVNFTDPLRGGSPTYIGREADWESASRRLECGRRGEMYFARLVPAAGRGRP